MVSSEKKHLKRCETVMLAALKSSGKILKDNIRVKKQIRDKGNTGVDIVTQVDLKSEKNIIGRISKAFPDHAIMAEESLRQESKGFKWIIDPLDGTINFSHSFPNCTVSIALENKGKVIMGGVFDPFRNELFFAQKGKGATLNGKRISVSKVPKLNRALLCTGFPYDLRQGNNADRYLKLFKKFLLSAQAVRRCGSAAMDLCYLACGRFDGFWELKLNPWDTGAAQLIVTEAGGRVTTFSGKPFSLYQEEILASNKKIHAEMVKVLKKR